MKDQNRWIELIKKLRVEHGIGILDAERIALANPQWRRWVEHRINMEARCRRMALSHIRHNGVEALIEQGERLKIR